MNKYFKKKQAHGFKDTFNFFMIEGLNLVSDFEIPYITKYSGPVPKRLTSYIKSDSKSKESFLHFYLYDYTFDGRNGVWYGCQENSKRIKSLIAKLSKYQGIISPDFSVYIDLPLAAQIWNIYRDRVMCMWMRSLGFNVVFNIRWADYRTYDLVFFGIEKHSTLAIGSHGLIKNPENRQIFMDGFLEMIKRLEPSCLIIYGPVLKEMREVCDAKNIKIINFDSEQTTSRKEKGYGWWK